MIRMFVRHSVRDYRAWRRGYDAFGRRRGKMGVKRHAVYRSAARPNDVTVTHDFASIGAARKFVASRELRSAMKAAGVRGKPMIWFTRPA